MIHKKQKTTEKKKKTKKELTMQFIALSTIVVVAIISGFYVGNYYLGTKQKQVDWTKFDEKDYLPNIAEVTNRNLGKTIDQMTPIDVFMLAENNLNNSENFVAQSLSSLSHNYGKQSVYTYKQRSSGITITEEISSSSMKSVAKKTKVESDKVLIYNGDPISQTEANWSTNYTELSYDEYKNIVGISPTQIIPYIVSDKTIDPNDKNAITAGTGTKLANGNYFFTIKLTTDSAVMNYVKKIKYMSDLSNLPTFSTLEISFEVDKNLNFVSINSFEVYNFKYLGGIFVTCSGNIKTEYSFE